MNRCDNLVDAGRRRFLSGAGVAAAGAAATTMLPAGAEAAPSTARVNYPSQPTYERLATEGQRTVRRQLSGSGCTRRLDQAGSASSRWRRS